MIVVNQDDGELGRALVDLFQSAELAELCAPPSLQDPAAARGRWMPTRRPRRSSSRLASPTASSRRGGQMPAGQAVKVDIYTNPGRPVGAGVIQTIVEEYIGRVETGRVAGQVIVTQMLTAGLIAPAAGADAAAQLGEQPDRDRRAGAADPAAGCGHRRGGGALQPDGLHGARHGADVPDVHRQQRRAHAAGGKRPGHPAAPAGLADHARPGSWAAKSSAST